MGGGKEGGKLGEGVGGREGRLIGREKERNEMGI